jgi:SAM-dependent methyltransferase
VMEGAEKYHRQIDPEGKSSVAQLLRWIRPGSKVLEMGPATGIMTTFLTQDKGCQVTCVEVDPKAAEQARHLCSKMIVGDLNRMEWAREIEGQEFDYIIFADVLEHLLNPAESLQGTLKHLTSSGEVLISVPNIAYVGVIAELLEGRFDYRRDGLLDETHVHFFTWKSLVQLLGQTGLVSLEWGRTALAPEFSEFRLQTNHLGAATRGVLASVPDGDTYQFLVRCARTGVAALPVVPQVREQAAAGLSAQVYFDRGEGFSEEGSQVIALHPHKLPQFLKCACPAGVKALRIDPVDSAASIVLHAVSLHTENREVFAWSSSQGPVSRVSGLVDVVEAHASGQSVLIPLSNDPAVTILVDVSEPATLTVELSCNAREVLPQIIELFSALRSELRSAQERERRLQEDVEQIQDHLRQLAEQSEIRERTLNEYRRSLEHALEVKRQLELSINALVHSSSWRITRPLRVGARIVRMFARLIAASVKGLTKSIILASPRNLHSKAAGLLWKRLNLGSSYELAVARFEPTSKNLAQMRAESQNSKGPIFSIIMPTYKTDPLWLKQAIESVREQVYPYWELCIADDASDDPGVRSILSAYAANDPRIKVELLSENGHISKASNAALRLASGQYVVLLDHDDVLAPHALYRLAEVVQRDARVDVVYSDEDKLSADGVRSEPTCKPSWSPEYFLSFMYTGHISCFRTDLVKEVGAFRVGFEGSQDFDLMLRVTERTDRIVHIPEVLYHWRAHQESVAGNLDSKPYAFTAAKRAITQALVRRGFPNAQVTDSRARGLYCVDRGVRSPLTSAFSVSSRRGVMQTSATLVSEYQADEENRLVRELLGTKRTVSGCIALSVGATVPAGVVDRLLDHCADSAIGVASPLVLDEDGNVEAAGMALDNEVLVANFKGLPAGDLGYRGRLVVPFNVSIVHSACVVFKEELLRDIPSSVESVQELVVALCLAAKKRGWRCLVDPAVHAIAEIKPAIALGTPKLKELLAHYGCEGMRDPFLPAGLPLYAQGTEMPAV